MTFNERIKMLCVFTGIKQTKIAQAFGVQDCTIISRLKKGKFTFEEQRKIAEIFGCEFEVKFVFDDGAEFSGTNAREMIRSAAVHANMSLKNISDKINHGTQTQSFIKRIRSGKFTDQELNDIAKAIGCIYVNRFILENGQIV